MARDVLERELTVARTSRIRFALAGADDDADIRRLLRGNPMAGTISLSLEREPDFFADADLPGETRQTIIARDRGRVVCVGNCTVRQRFVNGEPRRVGYLAGLRLDASHAGRFDILRRGYEFFHELQTGKPADYYFTSIAADNNRARKILERGLPGMPRYEFIGEFVTVLLPASPWRRHEDAQNETFDTRNPRPGMDPDILTPAAIKQFQFTPCWTEEQISALPPLGLKPDDFHFVREGESIVARAALWDQRCFRQTVIRGYAPALALARPLLNLSARFTGGIRLPAVGETLANAFVSHLAVAPDQPGALIKLVARLRASAVWHGIEMLTMGFAANNPLLAVVQKKFRRREYRSRLYVVHWPDCGGPAHQLDGRILAPEAAWL
jgi:hypothetical protein